VRPNSGRRGSPMVLGCGFSNTCDEPIYWWTLSPQVGSGNLGYSGGADISWPARGHLAGVAENEILGLLGEFKRLILPGECQCSMTPYSWAFTSILVLNLRRACSPPDAGANPLDLEGSLESGSVPIKVLLLSPFLRLIYFKFRSLWLSLQSTTLGS
jgi:hypothetical protein